MKDTFTVLAEKVVGKVKYIRLEKNYKQEYLGIRMGCSQNSYSKIESGKTELTVRALFQIASILETDVSYFFNGEDL